MSKPGLVSFDAAGQRVDFDWGQAHELGSAAFWVEQTRSRRPPRDHRLGESLAEETVACVLGGYGLPADVGLAAFEAVRAAGLICTTSPPDPAAVQKVLCRPLQVAGRPRPVHYRFPKQRAGRVSAALGHLSRHPAPEEGQHLRNWLLDVPGIGPKTASWVARNWTGTDDVAIIDVHVRRAGIAAGFFSSDWTLPRDYQAFEASFRAVARRGGVSCAALDARIWQDLSYMGRAASLLLGTAPESTLV